MNAGSLARDIWLAAVNAVQASCLVEQTIHCSADGMVVAGLEFDVHQVRHVEILGAGKAGRGMAVGVIRGLRNLPESVSISGWINVPADCAQPLAAGLSKERDSRQRAIAESITLHAARPAGLNEPTDNVVRGTLEIQKRMAATGPDDVILLLISGGGSALLENPAGNVTLDDLLTVTRSLAARGATIQELNTVRSQLSSVKGGRLLNSGGGGRIVALVISDIIGDPLPLIASGPTVPSAVTPADAQQVLKTYQLWHDRIPRSVQQHLAGEQSSPRGETSMACQNTIIGSNAIAVQAGVAKAEQLGFSVVNLGSDNSGEAAAFGRKLLIRLQELKRQGPVSGTRGYCVIAGGETTVTLADTDRRRRGGRNQEVVLAAVQRCFQPDEWKQLALLSGGTDGEDGPTDAAGAIADEGIVRQAVHRKLDPIDALSINNSYPFFSAADGLLQTGPTHTNVMDVAVGIVDFDPVHR